MTHLFQLEKVKYLCSCGSLKPICSIYFCRHCLRLRCHYCLSHEVDSHYCGNCSENMPSAEAKQKKNRCGTCFDCPSCGQSLTIRATTIQAPLEEDKTKLGPKKLYYLACGFCRWTSRDVGLEDSLSTTGPWKEPECDKGKEFEHVLANMRLISLREKMLKEKKFVQRSKYLAAGRHGLAHLLPKRIPLSNIEELIKPLPPPEWVAEARGEDALKEFYDEYFDKEFDVTKTTNLSQRLHQAETQPEDVDALLPTHKQLLVKRSLRCRVCERNISKPEYSPVSIKFKIQLNAFYHVPQVRVSVPLSQPLMPGEKGMITLTLSNPTQFPSAIKFLSFSYVGLNKEEFLEQVGAAGGIEVVRESSTDVSLPSNATTPSTSLTILPPRVHGEGANTSTMMKEVHVLPIRNEKFINNCKLIVVPEVEVILPPKDETLDFDDFADTPDFNDDPNLVPWRKANKVAVNLEVIRDSDSNPEDEAMLGLSIEYDYVNTIVALESKTSPGPQKVRLQTHVLISLNSHSGM